MTAPKSTLRPRRRTSAESLPRKIAEWFVGERTRQPAVPWIALSFPGYALLPEYWQIWQAAHPGARPPAGYEWLADPSSPHHPPEGLVAEARRCAARSAK